MDLSFQFDALAHQRRALAYRFLREHRRQELQRQRDAAATAEKPITAAGVIPHLRRALAYRRLRRRRWRELHKFDHRPRMLRLLVLFLLLFWGLLWHLQHAGTN